MFVLEVVLGTAIVLVVAVVLAAAGGGLPDDPADSADAGVPHDRLLTSKDIPRLRLRVRLRGYRMDDVDRALSAAQKALEAAESAGAQKPEQA